VNSKKKSKKNTLKLQIGTIFLSVLLLLTTISSVQAASTSLIIEFDYTYDHGNFFANQERRDVLNHAASFYSVFTDSLSAVTPTGTNTWQARIKNPSPGFDPYAYYTIDNIAINSSTLKIYVGAGSAGGFPVLGQASSMGIQSASGNQEFITDLTTRGQGTTSGDQANDYGALGGSIWFNSDPDWYFGIDEAGLTSKQPDFLTTATHEIGHILGFGTADSWQNLIDENNLFNGSASKNIYGQAVPTDGSSHWAEGVISYYKGYVQETMMDPSTPYGQRQNPTTLDMAGLADIGWEISVVPVPSSLLMLLTGLGVLISCKRNVKGLKRLKKQLEIIAVIFILLPLLLYSKGYAEVLTNKQKAATIKIEDTIVTSTRTAHSLSEIPVSMSTINKKELQRRATGTVGDLFRDIPGIEILNTGAIAGQKRIMIRGESGARVLVLVDGQKISEQKSMDGAALLMDINSIERIEVIKGPASVLYGSEGLGGVINVFTKKEGSKPVQLEMSSAFNTNTSGWNNYISLFGGGDDLKGFGYRVSVSNSEHDNMHGADRETLDHTDFDNEEGTAYLSYTLGNFKTGVFISRYKSTTNAFLFDTKPYDFATPPADWSPGNNFGVQYWKFENMELPQWNRDKESIFFQWENISNTLAKIKIDAYQQNTFKHFIAEPFVAPGGWYPDNAAWMAWDTNRFAYASFEVNTKNSMDTESISIQSDWFFFESHFIIIGAEFYNDDLDAFNHTTYRPGALITSGSFGEKREWIEADRKSQDIYIQDEWNFAKDFLATLGFRYSQAESRLTSNRILHEHEYDPILSNAFFINFNRNDTEDYMRKPASTTDYSTNYSFGLVNNSINNLSLRAHYGTAHTLPTLSQLFVWSSQSGKTTAPNPKLEPETAISYEIGARYKTDRWNVDLSFYTAEAKNYITNVDIDHIPGAAKQFQNIQKANTKGIELEASYTFLPWQITPYVVGYYIEREFKYTDLSTKDTGLPRLQGKFGIRYEKNFGSNNLFWADLYGRAARSATEIDKDGEVSNFVSGWETANCSLGFNLTSLFMLKGDIKIMMAINNIFDRDYLVAQQKNIEAPGRHFTFKIAMEF